MAPVYVLVRVQIPPCCKSERASKVVLNLAVSPETLPKKEKLFLVLGQWISGTAEQRKCLRAALVLRFGRTLWA